MATALIIGSSDGIGLALTRRLSEQGWQVIAISRSPTPVSDPSVRTEVLDVRAANYRDQLATLLESEKALDACIYCAGVGRSLELTELGPERDTFEINLMGAVATAEVVLPGMLAAGAGQFLGLSSQADGFINRDAPAYSGSKAGLSSYLEGLALACRKQGVHITNLRLGFVDTKMAKADVRPFMITADKAARVVIKCLRKRPIRYTYPKRMAALMWLLGWGPRIRIWLS